MKKYIPILLILMSCESDKFVGKWSMYALLDKGNRISAYSSNEIYNIEITKTKESSYEMNWIELGRIPLNRQNEDELVWGGLVVKYDTQTKHIILKSDGKEFEEFEKIK